MYLLDTRLGASLENRYYQVTQEGGKWERGGFRAAGSRTHKYTSGSGFGKEAHHSLTPLTAPH